MSLAPLTPPADLPPRTWRGWWLAWPKWFRIGCWAGLGVVVVNVALAVRIYVGLMEGSEIAVLQRRQAGFLYTWGSWERKPELFRGQRTLMAGLLGRSAANVQLVDFRDTVTDTDLHMIGCHFPNLRVLHADDADISREGIKSLRHCPRLEVLTLARSPVDDAALVELTALDRLTFLDLSGTLITDAAIPMLRRLRALEEICLSDTDVTSTTIEAWKSDPSHPERGISENVSERADQVLCSIRWSDGMRSVNFMPVSVLVDGPLPDNGNPFEFGRDYLFGRCDLLHGWRGQGNWSTSELMIRGDGDFHFVLKIGSYESEPVIIGVTDGQPISRSIEFRMPCTKAEALRSAKETAN